MAIATTSARGHRHTVAHTTQTRLTALFTTATEVAHGATEHPVLFTITNMVWEHVLELLGAARQQAIALMGGHTIHIHAMH